MFTSALELVCSLSALIAVAAAVVAIMTVRRGADADLKGDVNDLARLVERIAKDQRSDRMRRVRSGSRMGEKGSDDLEVPPGAEAIPLPGMGDVPGRTPKEELRRRVLITRRVTG